MHLPHTQTVARIAEELGIHVVTLYNWRTGGSGKCGAAPASEKKPEGAGATPTSSRCCWRVPSSCRKVFHRCSMECIRAAAKAVNQKSNLTW